MQKREGRSFASPPSRPPQPEPGRTGRKRWARKDVPHPVMPVRVPLPSAAAMVAEIEEPEEVDAVDVVGLLSTEARRDMRAGSVTGFGGGAL